MSYWGNTIVKLSEILKFVITKIKITEIYTLLEILFLAMALNFVILLHYDVAKAQAAYKDGILEVTLPKKEQKDKVSRQIEVK